MKGLNASVDFFLKVFNRAHISFISETYQQGYHIGCTDGPDQEKFIASGGLAHHTKAFVKGYNDAFTHGPCP
jgi:hypothetical protein